MPDAYFDSNLNGNLRTSPAARTLTGNVAVSPTVGNLLAVTASTYYLDTGISTFRTNSVIRTLTVFNDVSPNNTNSLGITNTPAELPYRITRSPTITSRFTD